MVRTDKLALGAVVIAIAGGVAAAYTGVAEPYVSQSQLPGSPGHAFAGIVVMVLVAAVFAGYLDKRAWTAMGRRAGLETEGGGLTGIPDLAGTVRGRPVRAHTYEVSRGGGGEGSRSSTTYTVVEADVGEDIEFGAVVETADGGEAPPTTESTQMVTVDGYKIWGDVSEDLAREILGDRVREALSTVDLSTAIRVGDPTRTMMDTIPDDADSMMARAASSMFSQAGAQRQQGTDTATVSCRTQGLLVDADELDRRLDAVATVAEAVAERTAEPRQP